MFTDFALAFTMFPNIEPRKANISPQTNIVEKVFCAARQNMETISSSMRQHILCLSCAPNGCFFFCAARPDELSRAARPIAGKR